MGKRHKSESVLVESLWIPVVARDLQTTQPTSQPSGSDAGRADDDDGVGCGGNCVLDLIPRGCVTLTLGRKLINQGLMVTVNIGL